ncbi:MAG TPA: M13 family metallopeptidase, partial [Kofleriaceae bacterium]|nr:M13 family metallopeptidase [Kofleriaceae bacterium]
LADLRAYLRWRVLDELRGALPGALGDTAQRFAATAGLERASRYEECRHETLVAMGVELSRQYAARALGAAARDQATSDAQQVQGEIAATVGATPWLSPGARAAAAAKIATMILKVGFPTTWPVTDTSPVSPDDLLGNVITARAFAQARSWQRVHAERRRDTWENEVWPNEAYGMAAARLSVPGAFPDPFANSILFTAAFLRAPIYDVRAPLEVRLGGFGAVVGHEIMHALDFHEIDDHGELHDTFSAADARAHEAKLACLVDAGNEFAIDGVHLDGKHTLGENDGDYGGVRHAFAALAKVRGGELAVKGGDGFTVAQRFFIAYAQHWCQAVRPAQAVEEMKQDSHAPPRFRVNGPLASLPAFAQAFACPAGSAMVRPAANSCAVW